jgi:biopolymer transport protein ExbD
MARRDLEEINAGSMADIAFLLLIFWLVTTTMDTDTGILRLLPPFEDEPDNIEVIDRNVYEVLVNANNDLLVEKKPMNIRDLKNGAIEFLTNPRDKKDLPEMRLVTRALCKERIAEYEGFIAANPKDNKLKKDYEKWQDRLNAVDLVGEYRELPSSAVISLQNDRRTTYETYIEVQNELQSAINELRDKLSLKHFGVTFNELDPMSKNDQPKIKAVQLVHPQRISEAEPFN